MPYTTINPATGELLATYDDISDPLLEAKLAAAHRAFETDWRRRPVSDRARIVSRAAALLREKADEYAGYLTLEMGKRSGEALKEVESSASILDYYAKHAHAYLQPRPLAEAPGAAVHIEPIGVLLRHRAVEFSVLPDCASSRAATDGGQRPAAQARGKRAAIGVGLRATVRGSGCARRRIYESVHLDRAGRARHRRSARPGCDADGQRARRRRRRRACRPQSEESRARTGRQRSVHRARGCAARLGDPKRGRGPHAQCGSICVSSKRIIVVGKARGDAFLEGFAKRMAALETGDPADPATAVAPLSSERALNLLLEQIDRATSHGARIVCGGKRVERPGFYLQPTVLTDITPQNPVFAEELFGPVAAFHVVEDEAAAIALANGTPFGLGASVFTADTERGERVAAQIDSGMVFVNQPFGTAAELPFGGVKRSGFGRELSQLGFDEFVNKKLIRVAPVGAAPFGPARAA